MRFSSRVQTEGLGGLRPNTIVLCWPSHWKTDLDSYPADSFVREYFFKNHFSSFDHFQNEL